MNADFRSAAIWGLIVWLSFLLPLLPVRAEERISFRNEQGETINAVYLPAPPGSATPSPAVVMLHGCAGLFTESGKVRARERAWADILKKEGWALLLPDSFGSRGFGSLCQTRERPVKPELQRPYDAMAALRYLSARAGVDSNRIALLGWSNGAMAGLHTIRAGTPAAKGNGKTDFRTAVLFYPGCIALKKSFPDYRPRMPALIQHGALDDWTIAEPCRELVQRVNGTGDAPAMSIDIYPGAYHNFDHPSSKLRTIITKSSGYATGQKEVHVGSNPEARTRAIARTVGWLRRYLK